MDAVNLALPTNTLASTAMAAGDKAAMPVDGEGVTLDFATLLAAGLNLQQQLPEHATPPLAPAIDEALNRDKEELLDPVALVADPGQVIPTATPLPIAPTVIERIAQPAQHAGHLDDTSAATLELQIGAAPHEAARATIVAAEAASFAAAAADKAAAQAQFHAEQLGQQMQLSGLADTQRTEAAAEAAAHALNLQPVEQRPALQQPTAVLEVSAPVSSPGFADAVSRQVVWMVDKDAQVAELRINPPELGPVEVRLTVNGDQASAQFVSTHQEVREALETSIARLRESFAEAGIQLGQASVSAESFREQTAGQSDSRTASRTGYEATSGTSEATAPAAAPVPVRRGLVDTFA